MTIWPSTRRALGAYYTPSPAVDAIGRWALRGRGDRVLEPSMGDGAFLEALAAMSERDDLHTELWGVEMAADTFAATVRRGVIDAGHAIHRDFLAVEPFPVDVVVGNPPYVRLRHLAAVDAGRALHVAQATLGQPMDPSGSIWMPFVLHATRFLVGGGRLALVLPYELTYVRYARPLWRYLGDNFGHVSIVRVHERMFPEILQEVVLLLADHRGGSTATIDFQAFRSLAGLSAGTPDVRAGLRVADLVAGRRVFIEALLPLETRQLLERVRRRTVASREVVTFNIGYVCGHKRFFHPGADTIRRLGLPDGSLRRGLTSSRQLRGSGVRTSSVERAELDQLYLPPTDPAALVAADRAYIAHGKTIGVDQRYKCQVRSPWYVTPGVKVPDVLVPVFTDRPVMLVNDAKLVASNSLLCGYLRSGTGPALVTAWFTSLTLLQLEMKIHALGGGVMILVPGEAGDIRVNPRCEPGDNHLQRLHDLVAAQRVDDAFRAGDEIVLCRDLGLSNAEVDVICQGAELLAWWRKSARPPAA